MYALVSWLLRLLVPLALAGTAAALVLLLRRGDERWEKMTASAALTTLAILAVVLALMAVRNAVEGAAGLAPLPGHPHCGGPSLRRLLSPVGHTILR